MAFSGNAVWFGKKGATVSSPRPTAGVATDRAVTFDNTYGLAELDPTADANLITAAEEAGAVRVDFEGTLEAVTESVVQTATTCSAIFLDNDATAAVFEIRNEDASGTLLAGPFTVEASKGRIIVFPEPLSAPAGIFISVTSGDFDAVPGYIVP